MNEQLSAARLAERLMTRPGGATMDEIIAATGGPQYNVLRKLEGRGYRIRKVKEGRATRYFATPPAEPAFEATVTGQGQVTIPKEIRERLRLRPGCRVRFTLEEDGHAVIAPVYRRLSELAGMLGKPKRSLTLEEIDEAIASAAVGRFRRAVAE
jgi:AbrB family looped-hinge helix DNA binding protein